MIATIAPRNTPHFKFRAMLSGMVVDDVSKGVVDVTFRDRTKVLQLIRESGGTILALTDQQPLSKAERFIK